MGSIGAPYPVPLHSLNILGERDIFEFIEQLVGVLGHPYEPLCHVSLDYFQSASPASIVSYLLISQNGITVNAPVYWSRLPLNQAPLIED
jgi:hypothetical protein